MNNVSAILLMAGKSTRFNQNTNKTLYELNNKHLFLYSLEKFSKLNFNKIYLVISEESKEEVKEILASYGYNNVTIVIGGASRQESVKNALLKVETEYALIHDSARPLTLEKDIKDLISKVINENALAGTLYHDVTDTIKEVDLKVKHLDRNNLKAVTTPQIFKKDIYNKILKCSKDVTDELSCLDNEDICFVKETSPNIKVTTYEDIEYINYLINKKNIYKIGHSYDYHNFKDNERLILGGVEIDAEYGLEGYSDADVVYHSVCEAILGALGLGDIGDIFPDNKKENYKRNSEEFVLYASSKLEEYGYEIVNIDMMIYLQKPNLKNYKAQITNNIKRILNTPAVNVKATTLEKQGLIGTCKGIGTETVVLIRLKPQE